MIAFFFQAIRGRTWCSVENTGTVRDLKIRGLNVVNSLDTPSPVSDIVALLLIIVFLRMMCLIVVVGRGYFSRSTRQREESWRKSFCEVSNSKMKSTNNMSCMVPDAAGLPPLRRTTTTDATGRRRTTCSTWEQAHYLQKKKVRLSVARASAVNYRRSTNARNTNSILQSRASVDTSIPERGPLTLAPTDGPRVSAV